jgi:hypothetical protein
LGGESADETLRLPLTEHQVGVLSRGQPAGHLLD